MPGRVCSAPASLRLWRRSVPRGERPACAIESQRGFAPVRQSHSIAASAALFLGLVAAYPIAYAQTAPAARTTAVRAGLTAEDVIKLAKAGLNEDIIIQQIKKKGHAFDLST